MSGQGYRGVERRGSGQGYRKGEMETVVEKDNEGMAAQTRDNDTGPPSMSHRSRAGTCAESRSH